MITLIDLSSVFWRAWHATKDQELGAAFEATMSSVSRWGSGPNVAICLDAPPYKRKEIYPDYKAQRDKPSELAIGQLERARARLEADGYPLYSSPGQEADDIIASLTRLLLAIDGTEIEIVSGDKDLLQLIGPRVSVISTSNGERHTVADVERKFGVPPAHLHCWLSLCGDKSDNVPGCPNVGAKRATDYTRQFGGSLDLLLETARSEGGAMRFLPATVGESIQRNADLIELSGKLIRLNDQLRLDTEPIFEARKPKPLTSGAEPMPDEIDDEPATEPTPTEPLPTKQPATESRAITVLEARPIEFHQRLEPDGPKAAMAIAVKLFESRLYQKFQNAESIFAVIMRGRELGLGATTALDAFHVIQGRPTMGAALIVGLVLSSGKAEYFYEAESSATQSTWITKRIGCPVEQRYTFTAEMARLRGLDSRDQWKKMFDVMVSWRASTALARKVYPDVVGGLYTPDEIEAGA